MALRAQLTDDPRVWAEFFQAQVGGSNGFVGDPFQRGGFSLGGLFKGLARVALPVIKRAGKAVAKQALQAGVAVAQDALAGRNVGEAFEERGREAAADLLDKTAQALNKPKKELKRNQQKGGLRANKFKGVEASLISLQKNIKEQRKNGSKVTDALGAYFI
jgi:hypothetical protein